MFLVLGPFILILSAFRDYFVMTKALYRQISIAEFIDKKVFLTQDVVNVLGKICKDHPARTNLRKFLALLSKETGVVEELQDLIFWPGREEQFLRDEITG